MTQTKSKANPKSKKDTSFTLNLTLKKEALQKEYQSYLQELQKNFDSKGFRKGKAPLSVVEQNISQDKVLQEISSHLISHLYEDEIKAKNLKPIIQPKVNVLNPPLELDKDWQIEITACEKPVLKLKSTYKSAIKKINQAAAKSKDQPNNSQIDQIFDQLLKDSSVDLPAILLEADLNSHLNSLLQQLEQKKQSFEDYLKEQKLKFEDYQMKIKEQIEKEWTINLIIDHIAQSENLDIKEEEVKDLLQKNPQLSQNLNLVYYLLQQQKVIDFLKKL